AQGPLMDAYLRRPRKERVPVIFHPHGLEMYQHKGSALEDLKSFPLRAIVARHCRCADIVISQGGRLTDILRRIGVSPAKIAVVPNSGPDLRTTTRTSPHGAVFLFIGRQERRKGLEVFLRAVEMCNGANAHIVGSDAPAALPDRVV